VLDASGPDFEFIGMVLGPLDKLSFLASKLSRREIHMRELSRKRRSETALAFLEIAYRLYSLYKIVLISIRTQMRDVIWELRAKMPFAPSKKLRTVCFRALAQILLALISRYPVGEIMADREFEPLWSASGLRLTTYLPDNRLLGLADVLAWIDNNIARGRWKLDQRYNSLVIRLNVRDRLRSIVGLG